MAATRCRGGTRLHFFELVTSEDEIGKGCLGLCHDEMTNSNLGTSSWSGCFVDMFATDGNAKGVIVSYENISAFYGMLQHQHVWATHEHN